MPLHFGQLGIHTLVLILDLVIFNLQIVVLLGHFFHLDVGFSDVASLLSGMENLIQTLLTTDGLLVIKIRIINGIIRHFIDFFLSCDLILDYLLECAAKSTLIHILLVKLLAVGMVDLQLLMQDFPGLNFLG